MAGNNFYIPDRNDDNHDKYLIKKEDTFESVAKKLNIEWQVLRGYHNANCVKVEDVINKHFPTHLKYLLLKPIKLQANGLPEEIPPEKVSFSSANYQLPFNPAGLNNNYLGVYTIENGDKKSTIKEEINIKWQTTDCNGYSFFEVTRISDVYIDDYQTDLIADKLAEKTANIFYPLIIIVNPKGKWVDIDNYSFIKTRWKNTKSKILKEYQGEVIEEILAIYEAQIANESAIIKALASDWFLRAFFNGINTQYQKELVFENEVYFPISKKTSDVKFIVEQKIESFLDAYNLINVTQKGILADSRTKDVFEEDNDFSYDGLSEENIENVDGTYTATYFLNPNSYCVDSLFLECTIALSTPQKVTIEISNLVDRGKIMPESKSNLFVEEKKKEESLFSGVLRRLKM